MSALEPVLRAGLAGERATWADMADARDADADERSARYRAIREAEGQCRALVLAELAQAAGFERHNLELVLRDLDRARVRLLDAEADGREVGQ